MSAPWFLSISEVSPVDTLSRGHLPTTVISPPKVLSSNQSDSFAKTVLYQTTSTHRQIKKRRGYERIGLKFVFIVESFSDDIALNSWFLDRLSLRLSVFAEMMIFGVKSVTLDTTVTKISDEKRRRVQLVGFPMTEDDLIASGSTIPSFFLINSGKLSCFAKNPGDPHFSKNSGTRLQSASWRCYQSMDREQVPNKKRSSGSWFRCRVVEQWWWGGKGVWGRLLGEQSGRGVLWRTDSRGLDFEMTAFWVSFWYSDACWKHRKIWWRTRNPSWSLLRYWTWSSSNECVYCHPGTPQHFLRSCFW